MNTLKEIIQWFKDHILVYFSKETRSYIKWFLIVGLSLGIILIILAILGIL